MVFVILVSLELLIYYLYPVENVNRQVEAEENRFFKKRLKLFLYIDLFIAIIFILLKKDRYLILVMTTFVMVVITMILGKYKNNRKEVRDIPQDSECNCDNSF